MEIGSIPVKWFLTISLFSTLSYGIGLGVRNGKNTPSYCPFGQYFASNECRPCNQCVDGQIRLLNCTATENTICITCKQLESGIRCLNNYGENRLKRLMESRVGGPRTNRRQHPCLRIGSHILTQLNTTSRSKIDEHLHTCSLLKNDQKTQWVKITKREATATELTTETPEGFGATTSSTISPNTSSTLIELSDDKRILTMDIPRQKNGGRNRNISGRAKSNSPQWSHETKPIDRGGLELVEQDGDTPDQRIVPSVDSVDKGKGFKSGRFRPTNSASAPTDMPNVILGKPFGNDVHSKNGNGDRNFLPDKTAKADDSDSDSGSSSSSSSWWSDHTEWLYSLMAAGVVILALSIFVVSRLNARGKPGLRPTTKKLNMNANDDPVRGGSKEESLEMGDFEDLVLKGSLLREPDDPKTRNILGPYELDPDLGKSKHFSLCHSQSSNLEMNNKPSDNSWAAALKSTASMSRMDWLAKSSDVKDHNDYGSYHSEAETQTDRETISPNSKTVFDTKWQFSGTFSKDGGVLKRENSDVSLIVGCDAVLSGQYVTIHGAIFTDASEIRSKFGIGSSEMLITPLVEYHAEGAYHFQNHVSVKLPHALSDDFDASFIKFYTFTVDDCGNVLLESLPMKSKYNNTLDGADAFWEISNQGRIFIAKTTHFSGYFCTMCESKFKLPSVYARVFGSHIQIKSSRREIRLILYLWDRRLNIKDFIEAIRQQECDMDRQLLADEPIPLMDNASSDSSIVMRMETLGDPDDQELWRHVTRSKASRPLFKPLQVRKLRQIVLCCQQNDPMRVEWAMENVPGKAFPSNVFQCLIEMVHVPEGVTNYEEALQDAEEENIRTFYVRNLKMAQPAQVTSEVMQSRQDLLKKTMTHILDRRDMEGICQAFGMNKKDIGNLSRKFDSDDALKTGLLDECSRKCGMDHFLQALPQILQQTQLFHVIEYLQDRDLLSTLSSCKQQIGCESLGSPSLQLSSSPVCDKQVSESTVCKSVSQPHYEQESRQRSVYTPSNSLNSTTFENGHGRPSHNHLHLQIHPTSSMTMKKEDGSQASPDSDYNSPTSSPPSYQVQTGHCNCVALNRINDNISPTTGDLNISTVSTTSSNNIDNSNFGDSFNNNCPDNNSRQVHNNNNMSTLGDSFAGSQNSSVDSHSNNCSTSVSDDSDFDDSCLATIDSLDLQRRSYVSDWSLHSEETSRKELVASGQQPDKVKGVAYPEIPEEQVMSCNGPLAVSNMTPSGMQLDNRLNDGVPSLLSNGSKRQDVHDDTMVKVTHI